MEAGYGYGYDGPGSGIDYHHDDSEAWRSRWLILLAVLVSIFLHVVLVFLFLTLRVSKSAAPLREVTFERPMRVDRVSIDPSLLEPLPQGDTDVAGQEEGDPVSEQPFVTEELELIDIQNSLPNQDILATPSATTIENVTPIEQPSPEEAQAVMEKMLAEIEAESVDQMARELDSVRDQLIRHTKVSETQPVIAIPAADDDLGESTGDVLQDMAAEKSARAGGDVGVPDGYASLDDLLRYGGPNVDLTKPIMMPTDLLFAYNEANLADGARLSLMKLAFIIQKNPDSTFVIEGHTDSFGTAGYNLDLSKRRADAVKAWLVDTLKLGAASLSTVGHGMSQPIVDPDGTIEEQSLNRRVEVVIKRNAQGQN